MKITVNEIDGKCQDILNNNGNLVKGSLKGTVCPSCGQLLKIYVRKISSNMLKGLEHFYRNFDNDSFHHITEIFQDLKDPAIYRGDFAKLRYWGLIDGKDKCVGFWKLTDLGVEFLNGTYKIFSKVKIYDRKFVSFDGDLISVHDIV